MTVALLAVLALFGSATATATIPHQDFKCNRAAKYCGLAAALYPLIQHGAGAHARSLPIPPRHYSMERGASRVLTTPDIGPGNPDLKDDIADPPPLQGRPEPDEAVGLNLVSCSSASRVSEEEYNKVMAMSLEEVQEYALRGNDEAKTVIESFYKNECEGIPNMDGVFWSASHGNQRLQLGDGYQCLFPPRKSAVVISGKVQDDSSDSFRAENVYSWCYCGDEDADVYPKLPPSVFEGGERGAGNLKIAVYASKLANLTISLSDLQTIPLPPNSPKMT